MATSPGPREQRLSTQAAATPQAGAEELPPRIPLEYCDGPSQRYWAASLFALQQSYKLWQFAEAYISPSTPRTWLLFKWAVYDSMTLAVFQPWLRIPRLRWPFRIRAMVIVALLLFNWLIAGNWRITDALSLAGLLLPTSFSRYFTWDLAILEHRVSIGKLVDPTSHIVGSHTVRILPHSTASLLVSTAGVTGQCHCIITEDSGPQQGGRHSVSIPVILNNTHPKYLQYSIQTFGTPEEDRQVYDLTTKDLKHVASHRHTARLRRNAYEEDDDFEDYLEDSYAGVKQIAFSPDSDSESNLMKDERKRELAYLKHLNLEATQSIWTFPVSKAGVVRIERVVDKSDVDVRIPREQKEAARIQIVPCPNARFSDSTKPGTASEICQGDQLETGVTADVYGYPPLRLTYHSLAGRDTRPSLHTIEGIAPEGAVLASHSLPSKDSQKGDVVRSNSLHTEVPGHHQVPLEVSFASSGSYLYRLDKVTDACGNSYDLGAERERQSSTASAAGEKKVLVYPRSQISFRGCGTSSTSGLSRQAGVHEPVKLLKGKKAVLQVAIRDPADSRKTELEDKPWKATVRYEPEQFDTDHNNAASKQVGWEREMVLNRNQDSFEVDQAGKYTVLDFKGARCEGQVFEPSECTVYTPPPPVVDLSLDPITDICAGEVGIKAMFSLSGEPPYRIHYSVAHGAHGKAQKRTKTIRLSRDELELKPEQTGEWTYEFISLEDANYQDIPIGRKVKQIVHPLAGVKFANAGKDQQVWSCEGDRVSVPIELKGIAPWRVEYRIIGQRDIFTVDNITEKKYNLDVKIPPKIAKNGGALTISMVRVQDGRGCLQSLAVEDTVVQVHRTKPTAAFAESKKVTVRQGETVKLPLKLTGEAPWKVTYRHGSEKPRTVTIKANNGQILLDQLGHYELVSVQDAHCPGVISDTSKIYDIDWITKPTVSLKPDLGKVARNGSVLRPPVCEGVDDTAGFIFSGHAPFTVAYAIVEDGPEGRRRTSQDIQSVQKHAQFELLTSSPGHRIYDVTGVSDATYTTLSSEGLVAPPQGKSGLLRIEQDVLARPTAMFAEQSRRPVYCVRDSLLEPHSHAPEVVLTGVPPFRVEFEIAPDGSHMSQRYSDVFVKSKTWALSLSHTFTEPGPYTVYLRKVVDSTGCERIIHRGSHGSHASIEVADMASIEAVQPQTEHCVGDSVDFVLQGATPWTVTYEFNGKSQTVHTKESRFSRVAERPGTFAITSVAHHQDSCKSFVTDIQKTIHPLPAARVRSGTTFIENIREGDQAEIVFEFEGTPPFTFTYTKSAPVTGKTKKPAVLETHTITGVDAHKYSVYTQSEGTWAVTSVSDAYCSYPPLGRAERKLIKAL